MIKYSRQYYDRNKCIIEDRKKGRTCGQIAIKHNISRRRVKQILQKSGETK